MQQSTQHDITCLVIKLTFFQFTYFLITSTFTLLTDLAAMNCLWTQQKQTLTHVKENIVIGVRVNNGYFFSFINFSRLIVLIAA